VFYSQVAIGFTHNYYLIIINTVFINKNLLNGSIGVLNDTKIRFLSSNQSINGCLYIFVVFCQYISFVFVDLKVRNT
jgi:hypothetical protein